MEMTNATYARSAKGIENLIKEFKNCMFEIEDNPVLDVRHGIVKSTVNKYWSGADADKWLKEFDEIYNRYIAKVKKYKKDVEAELNNELARFKKEQGKI